MEIPIIDIFAGPGGLGEGFSAYLNPETNQKEFKIGLSVEKDFYAHQTLTLRSFFHQFNPDEVPPDYYEFVKGNISQEELFKKWPEHADKAKKEAWKAELGEEDGAIPNDLVDDRICQELNGEKDWLLIGGPPCQAYSVVGRSRRQEKILDEKKDKRVGLYKQYLRILAVHNPAVFVMENVKGLLSAKTEASPVFSKILNDLADPVKVYLSEYRSNGKMLSCPGYKLYSLVVKPKSCDSEDNPVFRQQDFIIYSEKNGIPQTRHRVIILGIRKDIEYLPEVLEIQEEVPLSSVLSDLPRLRSGLSKINDNKESWKSTLYKILDEIFLLDIEEDVKKEVIKQLRKIRLPHKGTGANYISTRKIGSVYRPDWYIDEKMQGVCNHTSRRHMASDLLRYFFVSCFAKVKKRSPKLKEFPSVLLPAHKNVQAGIEDNKFADRFRVQLWNNPCKTITSHISKDGHYYIHPDPTQSRSFTVREAARIQTFPDNYYFCGPRTSQFIQVGNAVPPLLAYQIADIVYMVFQAIPNQQFKYISNEAFEKTFV